MIKKIFTFFIGLAILVSSNTVLAGILVSPTIINFLPNQLPRQDVVVMNQGDSNAYIEVTPYLVEHPGTKHEKKVLIHNPGKLGLLVSPSKFIIPPKQHRMLRIMQLSQHLKKDKIYRITVAPIPNKLLPVHMKNVNGRKVGVRVVVAYGILATVRPDHLSHKLTVKRRGKRLVIQNKGNTNIVIVGGKQCSHNNCFKLPPHRMYSGNIWEVNLPFSKPVDITTSFIGKRQNITSN